MPLEALMLFNPKAGKRDASIEQLPGLLKRLEGGGIATEVVKERLERPGELLEHLKGKDLLIVCGGDGTLHQVLPAAVRAGIPVGLVPLGTANVLARELQIPNRLEDAVDLVIRGKKRKIFLGRADGRLFHLMAGFGADGYIISQVGTSLKRMLGIVAFWVMGLLRFWSYPLEAFEVEADGKQYAATFAVVSNSRFYGRHLLVAPKASVFDGSLDLCLFNTQSHFRFLWYLWGVLWGRHINFKDVVYVKADKVEVRGRADIPVQLDGELAGYLPRTIGLAEENLEVFIG